MCLSKKTLLFAAALLLFSGVPAVHAQMAVIDVSAIARLVEQVRTMQEQLETARGHLEQARQEYNSITGPRGFERLLSGTTRNYLPADWDQLMSATTGALAAYNGLSRSFNNLIEELSVLTSGDLERFSNRERQYVQAVRRSVGISQALTREALRATSQRFASIQQLVDAIPAANDQKAVLDLQARIAAEQGMLQNEQTKLQVMGQIAHAEERALQQQAWEQSIAGYGHFATRFQPTFPTPPSFPTTP